jgi:hypothetical protein
VLRGVLEDAGMQVVGEAADGLDGSPRPRWLAGPGRADRIVTPRWT